MFVYVSYAVEMADSVEQATTLMLPLQVNPLTSFLPSLPSRPPLFTLFKPCSMNMRRNRLGGGGAGTVLIRHALVRVCVSVHILI